MNWTLEVVVVPVSDLDRAKDFYAEKLGFNVDHDTTFNEDVRIMQLTPPGSGCSIVIGTGLGMQQMEPGSIKGLQLVVPDVRAAHAQLVERGADVSDVQFIGPDGQRAAQESDDLNYAGFIFFDDPDGNCWSVQQMNERA